MIKTLEGIKVIDMCLAAAGPSTTKLLAEYGADDIWVEPIGGAVTTRWLPEIDFYGGNKKSIAMNLKTDEGREIIYRLVKDADVFVSNYRPGALKKLGLTYEDLKAINPRLIYATVTGWGEDGPKKDDPGYDTVCYWAASGLLSDLAERGTVGVPPSGVGDSGIGKTLCMGILAALLHRQKTGEGMKVWTSLYAEALYVHNHAIVNAQIGSEYPKTRKAPDYALLNTYQTKDGKWFAMLTQKMPDFWNILKAIGRDDLVGNPKWKVLEDTYYENAPEIVEILDAGFRQWTMEEALTKMKAMDVPISEIISAKESANNPQAHANQYFTKIRPSANCRGVEEIWMPSSPVKFGDLEPAAYTPAPKVGAHTIEVLKEYGYSDEQIQALLSAKIVET